MFDINAAEREAKEELSEEQAKRAKGKIKAHLVKLSQARAIVANLEREYEAIKLEAASDLPDAEG